VHKSKPISAHNETPKNLMKLGRERVRTLAVEAGFADAGVTALPHANEKRDAARFEEWIAAGRAGSMRYLERRNESGELVRTRVKAPFPWARSAIVCWAPYDRGESRSIDVSDPGAGWIARYAWTGRQSAKPQGNDARGARQPSDYHRVLLKRLRALEEKLRTECGEFESRIYVDTGPIVERSLAVAAGLGWTGKNACIIHPKLGSFGFLAVLITSMRVGEPAERAGRAELAGLAESAELAELAEQASSADLAELASQQAASKSTLLSVILSGAPSALADGAESKDLHFRSPSGAEIPPDAGTERTDEALALKGHDFSRAERASENIGASASEGNPFEVPDRCGSCTRCIEACPTGALIAPYQMDARRCISYLTIEHKGPVSDNLMEQMGRQVFGCDICQDVCPWNAKALRSGPMAIDSELEPRPELVNPALDWLASLDEKTSEREFNGSPVRRAGFEGLRRNVAIAMGNSGMAHFAPKLEEWATAVDEGLRTAARWALGRLRK